MTSGLTCVAPLYSFYKSYLGLLFLEVCRTLDVLGSVCALDPGLGHVEHLSLLRLLRCLGADFLVLLNSVVGKVSSTHSARCEIVPGLGGEYRLPGGGGGGLKMSFISFVYSSVEKCFVKGIVKLQLSTRKGKLRHRLLLCGKVHA